MNDAGLPFVSVIVPLPNSDAQISLCLAALDRQTYPMDAFEVIVATRPGLVELNALGPQRMTVTSEDLANGYALRNLALSHARGEVLAFTNADCIADDSWIERGVAALTGDPGCAVAGGPVEKVPRDPDRPSAAELFECVASYSQKVFIEDQKFCVAGNLFTQRWVFDDVGLFDTQLASGGDREWGLRVHRAGRKLVYAPEARVRRSSLRSLGALYRRYYGLSIGHCRVTYGPTQPIAALLKDMAYAVLPPLRRFATCRTHPLLRPVTRQIKLFLAMYVVKAAWLAGRLRLKLRKRAAAF